MKKEQDAVWLHFDTNTTQNEEDYISKMMQLEKYKIDLSAMVEKEMHFKCI